MIDAFMAIAPADAALDAIISVDRRPLRALLPIIVSVLLTLLHSAVAHGGPLFDETRRAVLPSEAESPILERRNARGDWRTDEWAIGSQNLDHLEVALASALANAEFGRTSFKVRHFYRQYMPARYKGLQVIVVNAFIGRIPIYSPTVVSRLISGNMNW
jgi:hypothetical protein